MWREAMKEQGKRMDLSDNIREVSRTVRAGQGKETQRPRGRNQLEIDASEVRLRSERRLGELMREMPKAKGGGDQKSNHRDEKRPSDPTPTLSDLGIDKNLAHSARVAASVPEEKFEEILTLAAIRVSVDTL